MGERKPAVKEGEICELKIEAMGKQGDGIAKKEGYVIIVKKPVEKDKTYMVKITKAVPRQAFGEVVKNE